MKQTENKTTPSITDLIAKDEKCRVENCKNVIDKALAEFNCSIEVAMIVRPSGNFPMVQINANPPKKTE